MKAAICSLEDRSDGNHIIFDVDESSYTKEVERIITKDNALDGTAITTNWGYPEGNVIISIGNVILSYDDYDLLIDFKEDDSYTFLFMYGEETWRVLIQNAIGIPVDDEYRQCQIVLSVIEKYTDMETS